MEPASPTALYPALAHLARGPGAILRLPELAAGIAHAANEDALFVADAGGELATACLLIAYGYERTGLGLRRGRGTGIYDLLTPLGAKLTFEQLARPYPSSLIALDLLRMSCMMSKDLPAEECLAWAFDFGRRPVVIMDRREIRKLPADVLAMSRRAVAHAQTLYQRYFAPRALVLVRSTPPAPKIPREPVATPPPAAKLQDCA